MTPNPAFAEPDGVYLLSHSVGLPLRDAAATAIADHFDVWAHDPVEAWPTWLATIDGFRGALARLLGTSATSICPQSNVSSGATKILQAIRPADRTPTILLSEHAFPSLGYVCEHAGYDVRYIPADATATDVEVWQHHLGTGGDVDVVLITHVHSNTGELLPVEAIVRAAHDLGATTIVDVAQSVGVIPIDLEAWGADFVVGSCVKWLCGGPGAGWLWVREDVIDRCAPSDVGWFSHQDPFEFDIHRFRYAPDALRFWGGTPAVLPFAVARRSIEAIDATGVGEIRRHNLRLGRAIIEACGDRIASPTDDAIRSGTTIIAGDAMLVESLGEVGIAVDHRVSGLRVSPHIYNDEADIDALLDQLELDA